VREAKLSFSFSTMLSSRTSGRGLLLFEGFRVPWLSSGVLPLLMVEWWCRHAGSGVSDGGSAQHAIRASTEENSQGKRLDHTV
jgi:hypothetical protein